MSAHERVLRWGEFFVYVGCYYTQHTLGPANDGLPAGPSESFSVWLTRVRNFDSLWSLLTTARGSLAWLIKAPKSSCGAESDSGSVLVIGRTQSDQHESIVWHDQYGHPDTLVFRLQVRRWWLITPFSLEFHVFIPRKWRRYAPPNRWWARLLVDEKFTHCFSLYVQLKENLFVSGLSLDLRSLFWLQRM